MTADPFAMPGEALEPYVDANGIHRDVDGAPLIIPPGGGEPVRYQRASYVPNLVDNAMWLMKWKTQILALGLAQHDDLRQRVAGCEYGSPELLALIDEVQHRVDDSAQWGTDVHLFTEPGTDQTGAPDDMRPDLLAYDVALQRAGVTILDTEVFVVDDELGIAGTLDHLADVPGYGVCVIDVKTGQFHPRACAVQLAPYARGQRYDPATGQRSPLQLDRLSEPNVNRQRGIIARIPRQGASCTLRPVRIDRGYELARLAMQLVPHEAGTVDEWCEPEVVKVTRAETVQLMIAGATSRDELHAIRAATPDGCWTKALAAAANARWREVA
jgi:hypothetical protein